MNWLVTGGCGFLGVALVRRLLGQGGHNIRVIDNLAVGSRRDLSSVANYTELSEDMLGRPPSGVELLVGDVKDETLARKVSSGCDIVAHFAANTGVAPSVENPRDDLLVNVIGTFNYLEASRINNIRRFVFASSGAPAGEVDPPIHEEIAPHPVSPYGASKLAGEGYCSAYKRTFEVDTVVLRFGNIYGPGSAHKTSLVAKVIRQALQGEATEIYGDGKQTRDFIYIDDLIDAVLLAATKEDIGGEVFQIATAKETTVNEVVAKLLDKLALEGVTSVKALNVPSRQGDVRRNFSDTRKAQRLLGWSSKTTLDDGLQKTVSYFLNM